MCKKAIAAFAAFLSISLGSFSAAQAVCASYPYILTNGTTADATQVMQDFYCAALTSGSTLDTTTLTGTSSFSGNITVNAPSGIALNANSAAGLVGLFNSGSIKGPYIRLDSSTGTLLEIGSAAELISGGSSTDAGLNVRTSGSVIFAINSAEVARFSGSSLLMGTTSVQGSGTGLNHMQMLYGDLNSLRLLGLQNSGATLATYVGFYNNSGGSAGSISQTGSTTVSYATSSDARLKTVLSAQSDYRPAIQSLWIGDYRWNKSGEPGFGVLAQQAYTVMPHHAGVIKPAKEAEIWQASSEPFAFFALWGVKDLYKIEDNQGGRVSVVEQKMKSLTGELVSLRQQNAEQAAQIREFHDEVAVLRREMHLQTATR